MSLETEIQTLAAAVAGHTAALADLAAAVRAVATGRSLNAAASEQAPAPVVMPATTAAPADRAAAELAAMTPTAFMERVRELTQGVPGARDMLARVLKANGWTSFRTLDRADYKTAIDGIAAELAGERA